MKVLLINNDKGWSGGQEHLKDLAAELTTNGVGVHFLVRAGSRSDVRFREIGAPVHALPGHGLRGDATALIRLVRLLRRERFDIVSVNREHDLLLAALAWKLAFPVRASGKFIVNYHIGTARKQPLLSTADSVVCISEHVRDKLCRSNPVACGKSVILYHGIEISDPPAEDKFRIDRERRFFRGATFPLIGMLGEFWKNQTELVDAIPFLKEEFPGLKVAFVGDNTDPGLVQPVLDKIRLLGLEETFIFTGRIPRERIPEVFFDFDLSVSTHRNEGYGIVHLESLAAGTPLVAFNEGGMVDILRGEDVGILVDGGPREFAAAVAGLLRDHARRFAMGRRGFELVTEQYSRQAMGERYLEFYSRLLGSDHD
ncbi:glycosyltransferase family 1 protein [bacterium]|nr:glycosyltransferase family 1 protein [bacterium]